MMKMMLYLLCPRRTAKLRLRTHRLDPLCTPRWGLKGLGIVAGFARDLAVAELDNIGDVVDPPVVIARRLDDPDLATAHNATQCKLRRSWVGVLHRFQVVSPPNALSRLRHIDHHVIVTQVVLTRRVKRTAEIVFEQLTKFVVLHQLRPPW